MTLFLSFEILTGSLHQLTEKTEHWKFSFEAISFRKRLNFLIFRMKFWEESFTGNFDFIKTKFRWPKRHKETEKIQWNTPQQSIIMKRNNSIWIKIPIVTKKRKRKTKPWLQTSSNVLCPQKQRGLLEYKKLFKCLNSLLSWWINLFIEIFVWSNNVHWMCTMTKKAIKRFTARTFDTNSNWIIA